MRIDDVGERKRITIEPGEFYVTKDESILSTLLGSCVSVCLYDPIRKVAGINHFLLSNKRYARNLPVCLSEAGRYGIHSMELLINTMMEAGAERRNFRAKAFGGGSILQKSEEIGNFHCVGSINTMFIREFLKNEGIPLIAEELGGNSGRVIHFWAHEYSVYVKSLHAAGSVELAFRDNRWWRESVKRQEQGAVKPETWV